MVPCGRRFRAMSPEWVVCLVHVRYKNTWLIQFKHAQIDSEKFIRRKKRQTSSFHAESRTQAFEQAYFAYRSSNLPSGPILWQIIQLKSPLWPFSPSSAIGMWAKRTCRIIQVPEFQNDEEFGLGFEEKRSVTTRSCAFDYLFYNLWKSNLWLSRRVW